MWTALDKMIKPLITNTPLPGVLIINYFSQSDLRGEFLKVFDFDLFNKNSIEFIPKETYLTHSSKGVIRGMHFQRPPFSLNKLVTCIRGSILDVVVDINPQSSHYNKPFAINLSDHKHQSLLVPKGYAHGFLTLADNNSVLYQTDEKYVASSDTGVLWSSLDFDWPINYPLLSERDMNFSVI